MISKLLAAWCLLGLTVTIHAAGLSAMLPGLRSALPERRFWPLTWRLLGVAWRLVLLHLAEIIVWGLFYWWQKCLPDAESSFYFSAVTYTTVGYGDLVLPQEWRLVGAVEGLTGILMCGLSTGLFFAAVSKHLAATPASDRTQR
jgi:Ion channel